MMVEAKRARKAETPTQTSFNLRLRAPHFYPDRIFVTVSQIFQVKKFTELFKALGA
jgi:hypothetical protein